MTSPGRRLPHDVCRCQAGCDRRDGCLRYAARDDYGPGTPWTERYCTPGREAEGFIRIPEESPR